MKATRQKFYAHIKFVQLIPEHDFPRELTYIFPFQLDYIFSIKNNIF